MHALANMEEVEEENFSSCLSYAMAKFFLMNQLRNSCNLITNLEPSHRMRPLTS